MPSRRQVAFIRSVAVAVVGAVVIWFGAAAVILAVFGRDAQAAAPWLALAKFASLAWAAAVGWLITWPRLDEMEQETRKFSWFIGSTAAILLTAPIMLLWLVNGGAFLAQLMRSPRHARRLLRAGMGRTRPRPAARLLGRAGRVVGDEALSGAGP